MNNKLKTPLSYPGGKSRFLKTLIKYTELNNVEEIRDCFLGGGSFMIYLTLLYPNKKIWVNDKCYLLFNFWIQLRDNVDNLVKKLNDIYNDFSKLNDNNKKEYFKKIKNKIENENNINKAVYYYFLNKCSYSGLFNNISLLCSNSKFNLNNINNLFYYSNVIQKWKITNLDYKELLNNDKNIFIYLDPPYDIKSNLYGELHKSFNHNDFKNYVSNYKNNKIMISYNKEISNLNNNILDLKYSLRNDNKNYLETDNSKKEYIILAMLL